MRWNFLRHFADVLTSQRVAPIRAWVAFSEISNSSEVRQLD